MNSKQKRGWRRHVLTKLADMTSKDMVDAYVECQKELTAANQRIAELEQVSAPTPPTPQRESSNTIRNSRIVVDSDAPQPKFTLTPEMKATLAEAEKTGALVAEMPNGEIMFINRGEQPDDNLDLNCPHCGGSGHRDDVTAPQPITDNQIDDLAYRYGISSHQYGGIAQFVEALLAAQEVK